MPTLVVLAESLAIFPRLQKQNYLTLRDTDIGNNYYKYFLSEMYKHDFG